MKHINCNNQQKCLVVKLDGMSKDEMAAVLKKFDIKSPLTNNALTEPIGKLMIMFSEERKC